ncbi:hypothetical protein vseg_014151 [Gypsophila vaccaria]
MKSSDTEDMAALIHDKFKRLPASFSQRSIYRVPEYVRKGKESYYRPFLVSIGPVYFGDASLRAMEERKLSSLDSFLKHRLNPYKLQHYIGLVRKREIRIRDCYELKFSTIPSNEFVEMVLVDAAFSISFLTKVEGVVFLDKDLFPMYCEIRRDLFLEENQLPFFILEDLFREAFGGSIPNTSFRDVARDLIAEGMMPLPGMAAASSVIARNRVDGARSVEHLVDMMRIFCLPSYLRAPRDPTRSAPRLPPSVSLLKAAGVKFVANKTESLLDVTFARGVLEMPVIVVQDFSESLFRSIMLFEQRHLHSETYFFEYIYFLDKLIDTAEDVRILVRAGVLENWLGSDQAVVNLFNGIADHITIEASIFHYSDICLGLLEFSAIRWNRWKAILRRNYFNHPWAVISVIYAVVLLILTMLQTISSFTSN